MNFNGKIFKGGVFSTLNIREQLKSKTKYSIMGLKIKQSEKMLKIDVVIKFLGF